MKVLVLGCGPAGLMAAYAAALGDHDVIIMSKPRKSFMKGAQYLHQPIPLPNWVKDETFKVTYDLLGTVDQYRLKVYGPKFDGTVSPEDLTSSHDAWDIRTAYDYLWNIFGRYVMDTDFDRPSVVASVCQQTRPDVVISTIPAKLLCYGQHTFAHTNIWSTDKPMIPLEDNWVVCNGQDAPAWYRAARIQGHDTVEWPQHVKPPIPSDHLWDVIKPTRNNCTCFPEIHRMGRYGLWTKGVLSHEAFYKTRELLNNSQERLF